MCVALPLSMLYSQEIAACLNYYIRCCLENYTVTDKDIDLNHEKKLHPQDCKERLNSDQKLHHLPEQEVEEYAQQNTCLLNWSDETVC